MQMYTSTHLAAQTHELLVTQKNVQDKNSRQYLDALNVWISKVCCFELSFTLLFYNKKKWIVESAERVVRYIVENKKLIRCQVEGGGGGGRRGQAADFVFFSQTLCLLPFSNSKGVCGSTSCVSSVVICWRIHFVCDACVCVCASILFLLMTVCSI